MVLSFGYLVLRHVLQLIVLGLRGDRANEVEILVLRHQVVRGECLDWNERPLHRVLTGYLLPPRSYRTSSPGPAVPTHLG